MRIIKQISIAVVLHYMFFSFYSEAQQAPLRTSTANIQAISLNHKIDQRVADSKSNPTQTIYFSDYEFGWSLSSAGDVNNDGYKDVIIRSAANAFLFNGTVAGLNTTASWFIPVDFLFGHYTAVSSAGDVNGDGFSDVIVGGSKKALIFKGAASGLTSTPTWMVETNTGNIDDILFGNQVAAAGDVNNDGFDDVLIGLSVGTRLYYGSAGGVVTNTFWTTNTPYPFAAAGDINNDGFDDVLIGNQLFKGSISGLSDSPVWTATGITPSQVSSAGDVNGDGYDDVLLGGNNAVFAFYGSPTNLPAAPNWSLQNLPNTGSMGASLSTAGDINKDGYDDVIISDPDFYNNVVTSYGDAFIYYGSSTGLKPFPNWRTQGGRTCLCTVVSKFGWSVSTAGDINGDGYSDVLVSEPNYYYNEAGPKTGAVYVYDGLSQVGSPIILPINFVSFTASNNKGATILKWKVSGDIESSAYQVERSNNATDFIIIASLSAIAGNWSYSYIDDSPGVGVTYYRIQAKSLSGMISYSVIIPVTNYVLANVFISPNPAFDEVNIYYTGIDLMADVNRQLIMMNDAGQILASVERIQKFPVKLSVRQLPKGTYLFKLLENGKEKWVGKVMKQ